MTDFLVHTISDTTTGEITRYVIAPDAVTLGLDINETVSGRQPLTDRFQGSPVTVVARRPRMERRLRIQVEGWRASTGSVTEDSTVPANTPRLIDGDGLAAAFFAERE